MWLPPDAELPPEDKRPHVHFYADESCQNGHQHLVIGVLSLQRAAERPLLEALSAIREKHGHNREVGWTVISRYHYDLYEDWVRALIVPHLSRGAARFTALIHDTSKWRHRPKETIPEIGFNKLLYQLILHRIGRRYGWAKIYGFLDSRTTQHKPETLRAILNAGLAKPPWENDRQPFIKVEFADSKTSDLIQLTDLLTGAVAFSRNAQASRPEKIRFAEFVMALQKHPRARWYFNLWDFEPK